MSSNSAPRTVAELNAACSAANFAQAEDMARRFVATHPDDHAAWQTLLAYVDRNHNTVESERLAGIALKRFPADQGFRLLYACALCQRGRLEAAYSFLRNVMEKTRALSLDETMLLAEIALTGDLDEAKRIYWTLAKALPNHPLIALGLQAAASLTRPTRQSRAIGFLLSADWHVWIQQPIAAALARTGIPHFFTTRPWMLRVHQPQVVVLSDPYPGLMGSLRLIVPNTIFVNTQHGIYSNRKNYGLYASAACDYACEASEQIAREVCDMGLLPEARIWITGYPQMDGLFRNLQSQSEGALVQQRRTVLFAPTFNPELSAAFILGEDPVTAIRGNDESIRVVLTCHPHLRHVAPGLLDAWQKLARTLPNVEYFDSAAHNIAECMADVDVLISDVSSVAIQFLALDRPFVRVFDPIKACSTYASFSDGANWDVLAATYSVSRREDLAGSVRKALFEAEPEGCRARRAQLRKHFFGTLTDGFAGERIARELEKLLAPNNLRKQEDGSSLRQGVGGH
jgi:hypothetical protein